MTILFGPDLEERIARFTREKDEREAQRAADDGLPYYGLHDLKSRWAYSMRNFSAEGFSKAQRQYLRAWRSWERKGFRVAVRIKTHEHAGR